MNYILINLLPDELINLIYRHFFTRVIINGTEFKSKLFKFQIKQLSFKQQRNMIAYHNHPTI